MRAGMIRGKILLQALLATAALTALLCIAQLWWQPMEMLAFGKSIVTILLAGAFLSFLLAVDYDMPGSRARLLLGALVCLCALAAGGIIAQIWWTVLPWAYFIKGMATIFILLVLVSVALVLKEDMDSRRKLQDENYVD